MSDRSGSSYSSTLKMITLLSKMVDLIMMSDRLSIFVIVSIHGVELRNVLQPIDQ